MNYLMKTRLFIFLLALLGLISTTTAVLAQTVAPLPENNLIQNPWFRNGNQPSLEGWIDQAGSNAIWSLSQKRSNPSPDEVIGTSARLAFGSGQGGGTGQAGVDAYLYQVVAADPALTHLQFQTHWVTQWIDRAAVTIYGGESAAGPWTAVWTPLEIDQTSSSGGAWTQTDLLETTLPQGFSFYKVELFGRYPEGRQQGAKYTGVYFAIDGNAGAVAATTLPDPTATPAVTETAPAAAPPTQTAVSLTNTPTPTPEPEENGQTTTETAVAAAATPEAAPTQPAARPNTTTRPAPGTNSGTPPANDSVSPIYLIIIAALLLLVIVLGIGWVRAARR